MFSSAKDNKLDTREEHQALAPTPQTRTIFDASYGEIFWKSLVAGFAMSLGRTLVTVFLFVGLALISIPFLQSLLSQFGAGTVPLEKTLQQLTPQQAK